MARPTNETKNRFELYKDFLRCSDRLKIDYSGVTRKTDAWLKLAVSLEISIFYNGINIVDTPYELR